MLRNVTTANIVFAVIANQAYFTRHHSKIVVFRQALLVNFDVLALMN